VASFGPTGWSTHQSALCAAQLTALGTTHGDAHGTFYWAAVQSAFVCSVHTAVQSAHAAHLAAQCTAFRTAICATERSAFGPAQ